MPSDLQVSWTCSLQHARTHAHTKTPTCVPITPYVSDARRGQGRTNDKSTKKCPNEAAAATCRPQNCWICDDLKENA